MHARSGKLPGKDTPCGTFLIPRARDQDAPGDLPGVRAGPLSQAGAMDTGTTHVEAAAEAGQSAAAACGWPATGTATRTCEFARCGGQVGQVVDDGG